MLVKIFKYYLLVTLKFNLKIFLSLSVEQDLDSQDHIDRALQIIKVASIFHISITAYCVPLYLNLSVFSRSLDTSVNKTADLAKLAML